MRTVSPIQRMAAVLLLIAIVMWFFRSQSRHFAPDIPLIGSAEIAGSSLSLDYDQLFCEKILQMKVSDRNDSLLYFKNGLVLKKVHNFSESDTLTIQTGRILDVWKEILASPATVVEAPHKCETRICALFKLPGGQIIRLAEME